MIGPNELKELADSKKDRKIKDIIQDIDDSMLQVHEWYPWEEAILDYELPLNMRNRIGNLYLRAGWKYVYHHTSSENLERPGLTMFRFSNVELDRDCVRGMHRMHLNEVTTDEK